MANYGKFKNKEIKKQWLKDLRSGSYRQCQGSLCEQGTKNTKAKYCCLGVLARSIQKIEALPIETKPDCGGMNLAYKDEDEDGTLPDKLVKDLGLKPQAITDLINMNDEEGAEFKKIADFVEKNL
jgi:hypothetical protein